uniref:NADH-quinone oxidoreductase subunit L n=1 Tax=Lygus hesperus TaxID=30085 RepID=A0A0A9XIE1_LYGHE
MDERQKLRKTIQRNQEVPGILGGVKGPFSPPLSKMSKDSQPEGTPIEVDFRCRTGKDGNPKKSGFMKTTAQCQAPGVDDAAFGNFNVNGMKNWGKAVPLFDDDDPAEGAEDFDEIVYSRLAKINKMQDTTTKNAEEKLHKTRRFYSIRNLSYKDLLKLFFRLILIGIFCSILLSVFHNLF